MNQLTGIIITLNEENNIEACIQSIQPVCDEIIVVDTDLSPRITEDTGDLVGELFHGDALLFRDFGQFLAVFIRSGEKVDVVPHEGVVAF